ncbi:MAG: division/cell wall cluster transcriptional repressor MraZ [Thermoleophilia bacterium]
MQRRLLSGTYECSLDSRFRLAVPARLREPFEGGAMVGWWIDECLVVVPSDDWGPLVDRTFGTMSVLDDEARELSRFILAGAFGHELDKQGRIPLTAELREHAGIEGSKVRLIGTGDYLEIWEPSRLAERFARLRREGVSNHAKRLAARIA